LKHLIKWLLEQDYKGELRENEPLSKHCSLKVGGPAALFTEASDIADLKIVTQALQKQKLPWILLGGGTNILFANGGYPGCVIRLGRDFAGVRLEDDTVIKAGSLTPLPALVEQTGNEGLTGLECVAGIPGSVGGAVVMNAGTRTGEVSGVLEEAQIFKSGRTSWVKKKDLGFTYRQSGIREESIVLAARFRLTRSTPALVHSKIREQILGRKKTQPLGASSAGCWFRNPKGDSAGRLIDEAGLKGTSRGGAMVSEIHANFFMNTGGATAEDFLSLAGQVRESVLERFGIRLEEEVRIVHG
jgi:UDP-N-acetylmuramate dehydrogenase